MDYTTEIINISKMREGFFIGDRIAGTNLDVVIQFKITHMINAAGSEIINQFESIGIKYLTLNWSESPKQTLFDSKDEIANRIVSFIDESLKNGEGILAHSVRGQDRVCIVVIIYLMRKYNWSLRKCIDFLESKKQDVDIPKFFLEKLYNFGIRLEKYNQGKKKDNWNDDDNYVDSDEKLMRNTYVNGLPSNKNVKSESGKKKKKKVGWADNNPYGKNDYLFSCNLQKDLFLMKDIKPVNNHLRMRPSKSCVKNKSKSVPPEREYITLKDNNNNINNKNINVNNSQDDKNNNKIYNIQPIKQNEIFRDEMNNNVNQISFGLDSNILEQISNINNNFNNLTIPKNNNNPKNNNIMNNSIKPNPAFSNTVKPQKPVKQNQQYITNPVYNSSLNPSINNKIQNKPQNQNVNQNQRRINNFDNNNLENQKRANSQNQSPNIKNYINIPGQINNMNNNVRNYSVVKEQNNFLNDNNNNTNNNKVIFTQNYEQIVTNNINNYFIQNPEMINNQNNNKRIPMQDNFRLYNNNNEPSLSQEVSTIKKQLNNYINNPISTSQKIPNNQLRVNNANNNNIKNNYQGKKPINYNNYFLNENMQENQNLMGKYKVIDYNNDYDPSNVIMRNLMNNNPQQRNINNNNINMQNRNQFLGGINNYNPKKNTTHNNQNYFTNKNSNNNIYNTNNLPLNNFNPSLVRKAKTPLFTRQPNSNTNGPIKIQKDFKKPSTPDNINRNIIRPGNMRINYNNNNNYGNNINSYSSIHRPNSIKKNNDTIKRPSTAPQKDKNNSKSNNIKGKSGNNVYGGYMGQSIKRAPSPMIQSHNMNQNMNRTQKFNPAGYRAPSPMLKSTTLNLDPFKRTKY